MTELLKLVIIRGSTSHQDNRVIVIDPKPNLDTPWENHILGVLYITTADFIAFDQEVEAVYDHESFQIRPKTLYRDKKGIFFKNSDKKMQYLTSEQIENYKKNSNLGKYL